MLSSNIYVQGNANVTEDQLWSVNHTPAAATQATASKAAGGANVRHVAHRLIASFGAKATALDPVNVVIRDGASGAGTILASFTLANIAQTSVGIDLSNLHIVGTANTAMTAEFTAAGVANSLQTVTLIGYDVTTS